MIRLISQPFALILGIVLLLPGSALAADVALVIGNSDYRRAPDAVAAEADARLVADALADGGYDVSLGIDLDRKEMRNRLISFARKLDSADKVVIFFSGHAVRSDGVTYLAPTDQQNDSLVPALMDGVPLDLVLRLAASNPGRTAVFLDGAQYDGYRPNKISEPGLSDITAPNGVLVVSAAAPGRAIRRQGRGTSQFARDIVENFLQPGARTNQAARRMSSPAWTTGSVRPGLRLVSRSGQGSGSVNTRTPAQIEAALNLTRAQRREVQETLSLLGHDPRGIDGVFGPGSRTAIRLWQRANNKTETGYLDAEQHQLLLQQRDQAGPGRDDRAWEQAVSRGTGNAYRAYLEEFNYGRHAPAARDALKRMARFGTDNAARIERQFWNDARQDDRVSSYRAYLEEYPHGIWLPEAEERIALLTGAPSTADPAEEELALNLTRNDRLSIEQRLNYLGYPPGTMDGFFDSSTRWAIEGYQRNRGFETTGYLTQAVLTRLVEETGNSRGVVIDGATVLRNLLRGLE